MKVSRRLKSLENLTLMMMLTKVVKPDEGIDSTLRERTTSATARTMNVKKGSECHHQGLFFAGVFGFLGAAHGMEGGEVPVSFARMTSRVFRSASSVLTDRGSAPLAQLMLRVEPGPAA